MFNPNVNPDALLGPLIKKILKCKEFSNELTKNETAACNSLVTLAMGPWESQDRQVPRAI